MLTIVSAAVVLLFSAGACFSQGAEKANADPVRLGLILDMSGVYADVTGAGSAAAAKMAAEDFGGQVLGRPIEIFWPTIKIRPMSPPPKRVDGWKLRVSWR